MRLFLKSILFSGITILSAGAMAQETFCADVLDHTLAASSSSGFVPGRCTPATGSGASKRTDKNIYMGLVWSFGPKVSAAPDVLLGFRSIHINSSNRVKGADLSMRLLSAKQFEPEGLRLSYVGGNRNSLANLGVGYSFSSGSALLTGAVQASHLRAGADFQIANRAFVPYFELNTLKRIEAAGGGLNCSLGKLKTIDGNVNIGDPSTLTSNGLYTFDRASTEANLAFTGPYLASGTKTCFSESTPPV